MRCRTLLGDVAILALYYAIYSCYKCNRIKLYFFDFSRWSKFDEGIVFETVTLPQFRHNFNITWHLIDNNFLTS